MDSYVSSVRCPSLHMDYRDTQGFLDHCKYMDDLNHNMLADYLIKLYDFYSNQGRISGKKRGRQL